MACKPPAPTRQLKEIEHTVELGCRPWLQQLRTQDTPHDVLDLADQPLADKEANTALLQRLAEIEIQTKKFMRCLFWLAKGDPNNSFSVE